MAVVAIGAIIAGASAAAAAYVAGMTLAISIGIGIAVAAVAGLMTYMAMNQTVPQFNSSDLGTTLGTTSDPKTVIPVVYGKQRTGAINNWKAVGKDTTYLVQIFAFAEGEIDSFNALYMDNKKVLSDGEYRTGIVNKASIVKDYQDYVEIELSVGSKQGHVFELAQRYLGSDEHGWPSTATGNGVATACVVMRKRNKDLQNSADILQPNSQVSADLTGMLITDLVSGKREASKNGPSQILDYVTNTRYGLGLPLDRVDVESFKAMALHASGNSLYSNGACDPNATFKENLTQMCGSFGGMIFESFGKMTCKLDGPDIVRHDFNEDNISASSVSLKSGETDQYFNTLNVSFQDPNLDYSDQVLRYPSDVTNDGMIARDKRILAKDISYRFVKEKRQLDILASVERNKSLLKKTITFSSVDAYTVQVWDVIRINFEELYLQNALYRVITVDRSLENGASGLVTITAVEYDSKVYTDLDYAKDPNNMGSNIPNVGILIPPANLTVQSIGETALGRSLKVQWVAQEDFNRNGFYVQYAIAGSNDWHQAGFTSGEYYILSNMDSTKKYDIRVCAAGLIYRSEWVQVLNTNPEISYPLPSVPGLRLVNFVEDANTTTSDQFEFAWDDQSTQKVQVNGQERVFAELFQYYEIRIEHLDKKSYLYRTKDLSFVYDFGKNQSNGLSRQIKFAITAVGFAGMKSDPSVIVVKNNQAPAIKGFQAIAGPGQLHVSWSDPADEVPKIVDYAGTVIQTAKDQNFTDDVLYFNSASPFMDVFPLNDGQYYVRAAWYDVFGQQDAVWSAPIYVDMKWQIPWGDQDLSQLEDLLDLSDQLEGAINDAVDLAGKYTDTQVEQMHKQVTSETGVNIESAITSLHTTVTSERDGAIAQVVDKMDVKFGETDASIAEVKKTQATDKEALSSTINQNKVELEGKVATVSQESTAKIDNLTGKINSKYAVTAEADGVVAGFSLLADGATKTSSVIFNADKFAITSGSNAATANVPFMVADGRTYIDSAMIRNASIGSAQIADASINNAKIANASINSAKIVDASITGAKIVDASIDNAKIGYQISSNNWNESADPNSGAGWCIRKDGQAYFNGGVFRGDIYANNGYFRGRVEATDGYFRGTVYADRIEGDVMVAEGDTIGEVNEQRAPSGDYHIFWIKGEDFVSVQLLPSVILVPGSLG